MWFVRHEPWPETNMNRCQRHPLFIDTSIKRGFRPRWGRMFVLLAEQRIS